jgi:hypothetical protein
VINGTGEGRGCCASSRWNERVRGCDGCPCPNRGSVKKSQAKPNHRKAPSYLLANSSEATSLATLVDRFSDPVDPGIATDRLVVGIHEDDFKVLVDTVLVDPVRVEHPQVAASATNSLLSNRPQTTLGLELVDTLMHGLAVGGTCKDFVNSYALRAMSSAGNAPLGTGFLRLPRRTRTR